MTTTNSFEQEWRANVTSQLKESGEAISAARSAFEKLLVRVEDHDRRIERLENAREKATDRVVEQAEKQPAQFATWVRGNISLIISAGVLALYLIEFIAPHWK